MAQEVVVQKQPQNRLNYPELEGFIGTVFDQRYRIRELISNEFHFLSFAVDTITIPGSDRDPNKDRNPYTFQARVYNFNDLSPKVKSYRSRNLARISNRAILTEDWHDRVVTIFRCDSVGTKTGKELAKHPLSDAPEPRTTEPQKASQGPRPLYANAPSASKPKSYYKRESDRLRQRDRRAARTQQHRELGGVGTKTGIRVDAHSHPAEIAEIFRVREASISESNQLALRIVQLGCYSKPIKETVLRFRLQQATKEFLQTSGASTRFEIEYDILEYIKNMTRELVEIRRLNQKSGSIRRDCRDIYMQLMIQKIIYKIWRSGKWGRREEKNLRKQSLLRRLLRVAVIKLRALAEEGKKQISILKRDIRSLTQSSKLSSLRSVHNN